MTPTSLASRCAVALLGLFAWSTVTVAAETNESTASKEAALSKIAELNKRALLAYDSLEMETASALLHQALNVCKTEDLENHTAAARTHLHLGIVYISGLKFPELGVAELAAALSIDPKIQIEKSLANPEVQAAFEEARSPDGPSHAAGKPLPFPTGQETAASAMPHTLGINRIEHPQVTHAKRGDAVEIKALVPPGLGASKVVLAYMAQDANDFLAREMTPVENATGWYHESIPIAATRGSWVAYYIEARDADDQTLGRHGTPEDPHQITLFSDEATDDASSTGGDAAPTSKPAKPVLGLWIVLAAGGGAGYHDGSPEMNPTDSGGQPIHESGFGGAELMHVAPEIGYFHSEHLLLSAQGRFQYVTGSQNVQINNKTYHSPAMAFAGLAKLTWLPAVTNKRIQPLLSVMVGAGQIRHSIRTPAGANLSGCNRSGICQDTVLGGLALAGVGVGFRYRLTEMLGFYAAFELLAGYPHVMINGDFNVGVSLVR